jgi:cell division transport system permease protein
MRLVGASNKYIRGPFVVEGIIYGFFSAVFTMALFYPLTFWLGSFTEQFFGGLNLYSYYEANFFELLFVLMGTGVFLGTFSGWFATRRYLRV